MITYKYRSGSPAFTLIEMLAAVGIIIILAVFLFLMVKGSIGSAQVIRCIANLRNLGVAVSNYSADNDGYYPPTMTISQGNWHDYWPDRLTSYLPNQEGKTALNYPLKNKAFFCPSRPVHGTWGDYGSNPEIFRIIDAGSIANNRPLRVSNVTNLKGRILLSDCCTDNGREGFFFINTYTFFIEPKQKNVQGSLYPPIHRGNFLNALFADGHIETLSFEELLKNSKSLLGGVEDIP